MTTQPGRPVRLLSCHRPSFASFRQAHLSVGACDGSGFPSSFTHSSFHSVGVSIFSQLSFCVSSLIPPCRRPSTRTAMNALITTIRSRLSRVCILSDSTHVPPLFHAL